MLVFSAFISRLTTKHIKKTWNRHHIYYEVSDNSAERPFQLSAIGILHRNIGTNIFVKICAQYSSK